MHRRFAMPVLVVCAHRWAYFNTIMQDLCILRLTFAEFSWSGVGPE